MQKSDKIGNLAKALSSLQGEVTDAFKASTGRNHTYADLEAVLKIARPLMKKHELSISQLPESSDATGVTLNNILMHSSDEWISSSMFMPLVKIMSSQGKEVINVAQQMGSAISYARRYCITAMLGFTQTEDDNDGDSYTQQTEPQFKQAEKVREKAKEAYEQTRKVTQDEAMILVEMLKEADYAEQRVLTYYKVPTLLDLDFRTYEAVIKMMDRKIAEKNKDKK